MAWQKGPLPPNTFHWGGVVSHEMLHNSRYSGFYFADFHGDWVECIPTKERLEPHQVAWFDNSLQLPLPKEAGENITERSRE